MEQAVSLVYCCAARSLQGGAILQRSEAGGNAGECETKVLQRDRKPFTENPETNCLAINRSSFHSK